MNDCTYPSGKVNLAFRKEREREGSFRNICPIGKEVPTRTYVSLPVQKSLRTLCVDFRKISAIFLVLLLFLPPWEETNLVSRHTKMGYVEFPIHFLTLLYFIRCTVVIRSSSILYRNTVSYYISPSTPLPPPIQYAMRYYYLNYYFQRVIIRPLGR